MASSALRNVLLGFVLPAAALVALAAHARLASADTPAAPPTTAPSAPATAPATSPATGPATSPATGPTSAPAPQPPPNPNLHAVQRGNITLDVQGEGLFQPVDPYEVRVSFKA